MDSITIKLPLRVRRKKSGFYWEPTEAVIKLGFHPEALGKDPVAAIARANALNKSVDETRNDAANPKHRIDNIKALVQEYRDSEEYRLLRNSSRAAYETRLRMIEEKYGPYIVARITVREVHEIHKAIKAAKGYKTANAYMKLFRNLFKCAMKMGWRQDNPARDHGGADYEKRTQTWSPEQIEAFCATAPKLGRHSLVLAIDLAYEIGQRPGDTFGLLWSNYSKDGITLTQSKTGKKLTVPLSPMMHKRLAETARIGDHIIMNERTGKPYALSTARQAFSDVRKEAGLPDDLQFRDMRRTVATELGNAGATEQEIMSITGHRDPGQLRTYVVPGTIMARSAHRKLRKGRKVGNGLKSSRKTGGKLRKEPRSSDPRQVRWV